MTLIISKNKPNKYPIDKKMNCYYCNETKLIKFY